MGVDIVGHRINPFRNLVGYLILFINIAVLKLVQAIKETDKKAVQYKLFCSGELLGAEGPFRLILKGQIYHLVDQVGKDSQLFFREAIDTGIAVKGREEVIIGIPESQSVFRIHKCDDQPFGRFLFRIAGFVQQGRGQEHEIMALYGVRHSFQKVDGVGAQKDMDFIVRVKMLKLHVDLTGPLIEIKKVKQRVRHIVYDDELLFIVLNRLNHIKSPLYGRTYFYVRICVPR